MKSFLGLSLWCLLILTSASAWANGETLYVRPTGACANNGNGTAYGCAASDGAAGAYIGFANVLQNSSNTAGQVDPGDTLYVCGAHTTMFSRTKSGTSTLQTVLDGACPSDAGSITVGSSAAAAVNADGVNNGQSYWTIRNLTLSGGTTGVVYCNGSTPVCDHNIYQDNVMICTNNSSNTEGMRLRRLSNSTIQRNTLTGSDAACQAGILIDFAGTTASTLINNVVEFNSISQFAGSAVRIAGSGNTQIHPGPNYVRDNTVFDNGDGLYHVNADGIVNSRNVSHGNTRTKSGRNAEGYGFSSTWVNGSIWEDNEAYGNRGRGLETFCDVNRTCPDGVIIRRNYLHNNNVGGFTFNAALAINNGPDQVAGVWANVQVYANLTVGNSIGFSTDMGSTGVVSNNTFLNPTGEACIFVQNNADNMTFHNNLCVPGNATYGIWANEVGAGAHNVYSHNLIDPSNPATILARVATVNYTSGTIASVDPAVVIANPLLLENGHTKANSPARAMGKINGYCQDFRGRVCSSDHPDIGGYQATSGDAANTRTGRN